MDLAFDNLKTPAGDGSVLIEPDASRWAALALSNRESLDRATCKLAGKPLSEWRRELRASLPELGDGPLVVLGHQPAFIHAGVWAKHVVAARLARALEGQAVNLVVDSDVERTHALPVPERTDDRVRLQQLRFPVPTGAGPYELIERQPQERIDGLRSELSKLLGGAYDDSQLDTYFAGIREAAPACDWVDQAVAGRRAVDRHFGINLTEYRVSRFAATPLLLEALHAPRRFAEVYNRALAQYRSAERIKGVQRPMPDLSVGSGRCELPWWCFAPDGRRARLFVSEDGPALVLSADDEPIGRLQPVDLAGLSDLDRALRSRSAFRIRPRALALTIWARLFLADLFIHGIGGAKYDRISDGFIEMYLGIRPPFMACASATVRLGVSVEEVTEEDVREARRSLRDLRWNPQRRVPAERVDPGLLESRRAAEAEARRLKGSGVRGSRRREAFDRVRRASAAILEAVPGAWDRRVAELEARQRQARDYRVAADRTYFFAFHTDEKLEALLAALPGDADFRL